MQTRPSTSLLTPLVPPPLVAEIQPFWATKNQATACAGRPIDRFIICGRFVICASPSSGPLCAFRIEISTPSNRGIPFTHPLWEGENVPRWRSNDFWGMRPQVDIKVFYIRWEGHIGPWLWFQSALFDKMELNEKIMWNQSSSNLVTQKEAQITRTREILMGEWRGSLADNGPI